MSRLRPFQDPVRLREISLPAMPGYRRLAAESAWREAAGPALAARSRVRLETPEVLEVRVPDENWRSTVAEFEGVLLASLRGLTGGEGLRSLRVRIDADLPSPPSGKARTDPGDAEDPGGPEELAGEERLRRIARRALERRGGEP